MKDLGEKYFGNLGKTDDTSLFKDVSIKEPCRFTGGDVRIWYLCRCVFDVYGGSRYYVSGGVVCAVTAFNILGNPRR